MKPTSPPGAYEFRGFYALNGSVRLLVKNKSEPTGTWLRLNEERGGRTVKEFDAEDRSILLDADGSEVRLQLVTLDSNSTPIPVNGQPAANRRPTNTIRPGPAAVPPRTTAGASAPTARRRTAPPRPQWLQDRLNAQAAARGESVPAGTTGLPPNMVSPGPPPSMLPPTPPPSGPPPVLPPDLPDPGGSPEFGPDMEPPGIDVLPFENARAGEPTEFPPPFGPG